MRNANVIPSLFLDFMQMQEFAKDPLVFTEARGSRLITADGREFIDGLSGVFVTSLGQGNQAVINAMTEQLKRLSFAPPLHGTTPPALELTQLLLRLAPEGVTAVKLLSGGSEATEAAMKLARQYHKQTGNPRKYKIISRYGAYHGATMGALSAGGGRERKAVFEPLGVGFIHVHPPYCYRCPFDQRYPIGLAGEAVIYASDAGGKTDLWFLQNGRSVRGVIQGDSVPQQFIPHLADYIMSGRFPVERMITFYDLADINRAADEASKGKTIKPVLRMPR